MALCYVFILLWGRTHWAAHAWFGVIHTTFNITEAERKARLFMKWKEKATEEKGKSMYGLNEVSSQNTAQ